MKSGTDHDDSAPQPCSIQLQQWNSQNRWTIGCRTHRCDAHAHYPDEASARAMFCCDRGARWRFIVHHLEDDPPPELVDLTGLAAAVHAYIQNDAVGERCLLAVWRYLDGQCFAVDVGITTVDQGKWLVHVRDDPADAHRTGREPEEYLTFQHVLE